MPLKALEETWGPIDGTKRIVYARIVGDLIRDGSPKPDGKRRPNQDKRPHPLRVDMTGRKIGMLTVIRFLGLSRVGSQAVWECRCDCGQMVQARGAYLRGRGIYSCGCTKPPPGFKPADRRYGMGFIRGDGDASWDGSPFIG
jgi:hypothetical protein